MKRKLILFLSLIMLLSLSVAGTVAAQETNDNIVDIAAKSDNFDTLHTAIVAAGLADTLASADSTFTVFAPRDAAFEAVESAYPGLLGSLLADPEGDLTSILTYHVVPGKYLSGDVLASESLTTVQGEELTISMRNGVPYVNDTPIITVDIPAKNGVIHIIDGVLLPSTVSLPEPEMAAATESTEEAVGAVVEETPADSSAAAVEESDVTEDAGGLKTIAEVAAEAGTFNKLLGALEATGLANTFAQPGNYTVFAPTDAAFEALTVSPTADELRNILLFHVVGDKLTRDQLATDDIIPTLDGRPLFVNRDGATILNINGATVVVYDIMASNGIIHVIDRVLIP